MFLVAISCYWYVFADITFDLHNYLKESVVCYVIKKFHFEILVKNICISIATNRSNNSEYELIDSNSNLIFQKIFPSYYIL